MNVILGERYKEVTDEIIQYAIGFWGEEECIDRANDQRQDSRPPARQRAGQWGRRKRRLNNFATSLAASRSRRRVYTRYFAGKDDVAP
jgi:pyruvate/oxaloacetate carboxyltransferase